MSSVIEQALALVATLSLSEMILFNAEFAVLLKKTGKTSKVAKLSKKKESSSDSESVGGLEKPKRKQNAGQMAWIAFVRKIQSEKAEDLAAYVETKKGNGERGNHALTFVSEYKAAHIEEFESFKSSFVLPEEPAAEATEAAEAAPTPAKKTAPATPSAPKKAPASKKAALEAPIPAPAALSSAPAPAAPAAKAPKKAVKKVAAKAAPKPAGDEEPLKMTVGGVDYWMTSNRGLYTRPEEDAWGTWAGVLEADDETIRVTDEIIA